MSKELQRSAIHYHTYPRPGKFEISPTKPLATQRDLALAYSPGVAVACEAIVKDEEQVANLTLRSNLVAVVSNGTAVLGLGDIGPLAAKPVMEGKGVLFKKFAGIDVFDIEINEKDPKKLVDIIAALEPTFGAINLEDIKAPECFYVEKKLQEKVKIPIFHDDQHGTAIIVAAAVLNGLELVGKKMEDIKLVCSGAGAAAIACLNLLVNLGVRKKNIIVCDQKGVIYEERENISDPFKKKYAAKTKHRTLADALKGADLFLGVSVGNVVNEKMVKSMADKPLILALANPTPEVDPDLVRRVRPDAIIATGRSDHPNQVNNVLCFPFIFRGALDVGATTINEEMKLACVHALAKLARAESSDIVALVYKDEELSFGPEYIIPKPFDPRLIIDLPMAVAKAAMETGVAKRPIEDFEAYRHRLSEYVFRSSMVMKPIFARAKADIQRVAYCEGEDLTVLRAVQVVVDEGLARPIIIGRRKVVLKRIEKLGLRIKMDEDFDLVDPQNDPRYKEYTQLYHKLMERKGVSPEFAKIVVRTNTAVIGALMVHRQDADAVLAGPIGRYKRNMKHVVPLLGLQPDTTGAAAMSILITSKGTFFFCDPYVNFNPTAEQLAEIVILAAEQIRRFGFEPKVALLSHSSFGSNDTETSLKMRKTLSIVEQLAPEIQIEGEMHGDAALDENIRNIVFPNSKLEGIANLLVMPTLDAANISFNLAKVIGDGQSVGPILLGLGRPGHILTNSATVRSIVNMTAIAAVDAQILENNEHEFQNPSSHDKVKEKRV
jgi:malate dehydrogenase (oxaloacetate-decarboxylating)(NADP+)